MLYTILIIPCLVFLILYIPTAYYHKDILFSPFVQLSMFWKGSLRGFQNNVQNKTMRPTSKE